MHGQSYVLTTVDVKALTLWHEKLGYLGKDNVKRLASIVDGINLTIPLVEDNSC